MNNGYVIIYDEYSDTKFDYSIPAMYWQNSPIPYSMQRLPALWLSYFYMENSDTGKITPILTPLY